MMTLVEMVSRWGLEKLGRYYSIYQGIVVANQDDLNYGRIQVIIPRVQFKDKTPLWAYRRNQYSGDDIGIHILPKVGETVDIEFMGGNPQFPRWSFTGHNDKHKQPGEFKNKENVYGLKTKEFLITVDDDAKACRIERRDNKKILINDQGIYLSKSDNTEPMLLGNKTQGVIQTDIDNLNSLLDALNIFCDSVTTASSNAPPLVPLVPMVGVLKTSIIATKTSLTTNKTNSDNIKSKVVNLD